MHVMIMPTIESICEDYGLDYYDDIIRENFLNNTA